MIPNSKNGARFRCPVTALQPGDVFQLGFDLAVGLRDARGEHAAHHDYNEHRNFY